MQQASSSSHSTRCYFSLTFPGGFVEVQEDQITCPKLCAKASEKALTPEACAKLSWSISKDSGKPCSVSELLSYVGETVSWQESIISAVTLILSTAVLCEKNQSSCPSAENWGNFGRVQVQKTQRSRVHFFSGGNTQQQNESWWPAWHLCCLCSITEATEERSRKLFGAETKLS